MNYVNLNSEACETVYKDLCEGLKPDLDELWELLKAEAKIRGGKHVNAICGTNGVYDPKKVLLHMLLDRILEEMGY